MKNTEKNTHLKAHRQKIMMSCIVMLTLILCINIVSAWEIDNSQKILDTIGKAGYKDIEINNAFGLGSKLWSGTLDTNTETCGQNCEATQTITLHEKGSLIDDVIFERIYEDGSRKESNIRSYQILIKTGSQPYEVNDYEYQCSKTGKLNINGTEEQICENVLIGKHTEYTPEWQTYELGTELDKGIYEVKLEGEKRPDWSYDWIYKTQGSTLDEWAVWGTSGISTDYLVNYYKLDNSSGKSIDIINSKDLTNYGNTIQGVNGKINNALYFDGTNSHASNTTWNDIDALTEFSFCFWINSTDDAGIPLTMEQDAANGYLKFEQTTATNIKWVVGDGSALKEISGGTIAQNTWAFICGTAKENDFIRLWVNNVEAGTGTAITTFGNFATTMRLGTNRGADGDWFNGTLDEVSFFNKSLNSTEISSLYSSGNGLTYPFSISTITLNSPVNAYISPTNEIQFNATATVTGGATLTNMSLWHNGTGTWHRNKTNIISGTTNTTNWTATIEEGTFTLWGIEACDSDGDCGFSTENRTVSVDTVAPSITINRPLTTENIGYLNGNQTLNWSVSDGNLDSVWWEYNGTNTTLTGASNTSSFALAGTLFNGTLWANDSVGNVNSSYREWDYTIFTNSVTYNSTSLLTTLEPFAINITTDGTQTPIVYLIYNGTSNLATLSGGQYTNSISMVNVGIIPFYWSINYGGTIINTTSYNQIVTSFNPMNVTGGSCPAGLTQVMYFNFADAINLTSLTNVNLKYNFQYGITNSTGASSYGSLTGIANASLCLNTTQSSTYNLGYGELEYDLTGYSSRRYYVFQNTRLTNTTINTTLYSLLSASSTSFLVEIRDPTLNPYQGKYTTLLKWYPDLNEYKVVEMGKTDDKGQTVKKVEVEDVDYRIGVYELNGSLIYLANPIRMVCLASPCSYTLTIRDTSTNTFDEVTNIETDLTYNNGTFSLVYNDPSQNTDLMQLIVYKQSGSEDVQVCQSNSTAFTGILTCNVSGYSGILKAVAVRTASPLRYLTSLIVDTATNLFQGTFGLFLQFMIVVTLAFLGIISPIVSIIMALIALLFGVMLFKTITYPMFIGIAVLGGIIIHMMKRSGGQ